LRKVAVNSQQAFEFFREFLDFVDHFFRLHPDAIDKLGRKIGFAPDQFDRRNNQRKVVVYIVPCGSELLVEVCNFGWRDRDWLRR